MVREGEAEAASKEAASEGGAIGAGRRRTSAKADGARLAAPPGSRARRPRRGGFKVPIRRGEGGRRGRKRRGGRGRVRAARVGRDRRGIVGAVVVRGGEARARRSREGTAVGETPTTTAAGAETAAQPIQPCDLPQEPAAAASSRSSSCPTVGADDSLSRRCPNRRGASNPGRRSPENVFSLMAKKIKSLELNQSMFARATSSRSPRATAAGSKTSRRR